MKVKADDYFNNGFIEMARFGKIIFQRNVMSEQEHFQYMNKLSEKEPILKKKINDLVEKIIKNVLKCEPLKLLNYSQLNDIKSFLGKTSEFQSLGFEKIAIAHTTEYIQSIFVSSEKGEPAILEDPSELFFEISKEIEDLFCLIPQFYFAKLASYVKSNAIDNALLQELFEAQMAYWVRGERYQFIEFDYFRSLLSSHNNEFLKLFKISIKDILEGIKKMQYALSQGRVDPVNKLIKLFDSIQNVDEEKLEDCFNTVIQEGQTYLSAFIGNELNDVCSITGWSKEFVDKLSFEIGEYKSFFNNKEYSGWPILDLPVQKRPFVKIDNTCYCFDYYSFVDNFYRVIQKTITRLDPTYNWSEVQQSASESMVAELLQRILPGCKIYKNNYYPYNKASLKQLCENDLIVEYYDVLLIVEIKAGSFVFTAPLLDFEQHIKSYKKLIEEPQNQCQRTFDYLKLSQFAKLYNKDKTEKVCIDMSKVKDVFMMSVTVDNINTFAARAEKISFIQSKCNSISIAVDDLMIYERYFESPLKFLHFLKQRRDATLLKSLVPTDELDHLGMYINNNCYALYYSNLKTDRVDPVGFRQELDTYFSQLYHPIF